MLRVLRTSLAVLLVMMVGGAALYLDSRFLGILGNPIDQRVALREHAQAWKLRYGEIISRSELHALTKERRGHCLPIESSRGARPSKGDINCTFEMHGPLSSLQGFAWVITLEESEEGYRLIGSQRNQLSM